MPEPRRPRSLGIVALLLSLLAGLAMAATPFLPVTQHTATYRWESGAAQSLPLSPYRPERLRLAIDCTKLGPRQGTVLTTVASKDADLRAKGLELAIRGTDLEVRSNGHRLVWPDAEGCSRLDLDMGPAATRMWAPDRPGQEYAGDHRPTMDGLWPSEADANGVTAVVDADTRWDTSPTPLKLAVLVLGWALLAAAVAALVAAERPWRRAGPTTPRRRTRPLLDDAVVVALVATGVVIGGANDDDGFISQIIRTREMSGYVGNYARWNNAPEAPFGWFYELLGRWGAVSMEPVWLRILPALVALAGWVVVRHGLLPRLVPHPGRATRAVLVIAYAGVWLVFGNTLRPEVWYATGLGVVLLCVLVALERRTAWPLVVAALVAGLSIGTNPTGLVALAPFVAAARPLARLLGSLPQRGLPVAAVSLAALGAVVPLAFADQTFAAVLSANQARAAFGPVFPFWADGRRYWMLSQSLAARQVAVYVPAVALAALAWFWWRARRAADTPVNPFVAGLVAACAPALALVMVFGPTKLPHHFGGLLLVGPLAMAGVAQLLARPGVTPAWGPRATAVTAGASIAALGFSLHSNNIWWKLSSLGAIADRRPLGLGPVPLWPLVVLAGVGVAVALLVLRRMPRHAAPAYAVVLALVLGGQYANFAQAVARRGTERYTMGGAAVAAASGEPCLLERTLFVHRGGTPLPPPEGENPFTGKEGGPASWAPQAPGTTTTGWYALPPAVTMEGWPLVVPVAGLDAQHRVQLEFDRGGVRRLPVPRQSEVTEPDQHDLPVQAPHGATRVRLVATADSSSPVFRLHPPTVATLTTLQELAGGSEVAVAWNLAFFAPCLATPRQSHGTAEIPRYLLSDSVRPGNMSYTARDGGPFAAAQGRPARRVTVFSKNDATEPTITALELVELGSASDRHLAPQVGARVVPGWQRLPDLP